MILSICIPTYNRQNKILRTVRDFYNQILLSGEKDDIELVVSNNCSTDDTRKILDGLDFPKINFRVFHQTENIGFDWNTKFLYEKAKGQYIWYFGDDDIIFNGSVKTIFDSIKNGKYGGMRFSFMQPIGDTGVSFPYPADTCQVITDKGQII